MHVVVLVDASKVRDIHPRALSAYVAMAGLAEMRLDSEVEGVPSVLNMFRDRDAGREPHRDLTDWDRAFLKGLYQAPPWLARASQKDAIKTRMKRAYAGAPD